MITSAMTDLAELIQRGTSRPVVTDPRNIVVPCVLVEPPNLEPDGTMCGSRKHTFYVRVIGAPGAWVELGPLAELLDEVLAVLEDDDGPGYTYAELTYYNPLTPGTATEPSLCYRITTEAFA